MRKKTMGKTFIGRVGALLLILTMLLCCIPGTAFADTFDGASALQEELGENAELIGEDTVRLKGPISADVNYVIQGTVILDLHGETLTLDNHCIATCPEGQSGTLTIMDSKGGGKITGTGIEGKLVQAQYKGVLNIEDVTIVSTATADVTSLILVNHGGILNIKSGTIESTEGEATKESKVYGLVQVNLDNSELHISGGTIRATGARPAVAALETAKLTMSGGTIIGKTGALRVEGEETQATVTNGTIQNEGTTAGGDGTSPAVFVGDGGALTMSGGRVEAAKGQGIQVGQTQSSVVETVATATLSGSAAIIAEHEPSDAPEDRIANSQVGKKGELILRDQATITGSLGVFGDGKLTMEGGAITSETGFAIGTNGSAHGKPNYSGDVEITISSGTVRGNACGVYLPAGTMTVRGDARITGQAGIVVRGGTLTVEPQPTITATGTGPVTVGDATNAEGETYTVPPAAVVLDEHDSYNSKGGTVNLGGGLYEAPAGGRTVSYLETGEEPKQADAYKDKLTITDGTFTAGSAGDLEVADYLDQSGANGKSVNPKTGALEDEALYVAQVDDGHKYASLQDAVDAITGGSGTIKILVANPGTATVHKPCTITLTTEVEALTLDETLLRGIPGSIEGGIIEGWGTKTVKFQFSQILSGSYIVPTQPPTRQTPTVTGDSVQVDWTLGADGSTLTIMPKPGYEITDVTVNGVSKGAVNFLSGLRTGDLVIILSRKALSEAEKAEIARLRTGVENTKITLRSKAAKKGIRLDWKRSKGFKVDYYEVFRSLKRDTESLGKAAYYKTTTESKTYYINTKELKKGKRYYYRVRGVRSFADGSTAYTKWSTWAWRKSPVTR